MGWSIGYDNHWKRDIGYGVPALCDQPGCGAEIDRGLSFVCGGEPYGGEHGCGLYFCSKHLFGYPQRCGRCRNRKPPIRRIAPEHPRWIAHVMRDESWAAWRAEKPGRVDALRAALKRGIAYRRRLARRGA